MGVVQLIFLLLALVTVISFLFPSWNFTGGPVLTARSLIGLLVALIILYIVYLIVVALFAGAPVLR